MASPSLGSKVRTGPPSRSRRGWRIFLLSILAQPFEKAFGPIRRNVFVDEFLFGFVAAVHVFRSLLGYLHVRRADQFALRLALELPLHLFAAGRYEQSVLRADQITGIDLGAVDEFVDLDRPGRFQGDADTGEEVANEDIVKGYKVDTDTFVEVTKEELENPGPNEHALVNGFNQQAMALFAAA